MSLISKIKGIAKEVFGKEKASPVFDNFQNAGMELLARLTGSEMTKGSMLRQFKKSLYVFACISKIAEKAADIEWDLFKVVNSKGDTKEVETHQILDLIYKPNPFQTKEEFLKILITNKKLCGDAFVYKVRSNNDKNGKVIELWNLRPDMMTILADKEKFIKGYKFAKNDGSFVFFEPQEIIHIKDNADPTNEYLGVSALMPAEKRVQTEDFATSFQRDFFLNSARPDGVIKNPNISLTEDQKEEIHENWGKRYKGVGNNSKVGILEGGMEYQQISISQREMDYIESLKFTRDDILVAFKVPKPIVAITDDVNRANAETAMFIFISETIMPEINHIVNKFNEEMIIPDFGEEFYAKVKDITPRNRELELKEYESGIVNGYLLINEVRAKEGLAPIMGGWTMYRPIMEQAVGGLPQSEQKAINEAIIKQIEKAGTKKFSFAGRQKLLAKLTIREEADSTRKQLETGIRAILIKNQKPKAKAVEEKEEEPAGKKTRRFLTDETVRKNYAEKILKKIDASSAKLKEAADKFAEQQRGRVIGNIKVDNKAIKASDIMDREKENSMAVEFISPFISEYLRESGQEALLMLAPQETFDTAKIAKLIRERARFFAETVNSTTLTKLDATLAEGISAGEGIGKLTERVSEVYSEFPTYRSEMIARTEATAANNRGLIEGWRQSGVANAKEWLNVGDARVRPEHDNEPVGVGGEIVALDAVFSNGLVEPNEPNCRCTLAPAFIE